MRPIDIVALVLVIIGSLNWGLVGLLDFNLVTALFSGLPLLVKAIYTIVGLAGGYLITILPKLNSK